MLKSYVFDKLVKCCDNEMFLIIILYFCSIYSIIILSIFFFSITSSKLFIFPIYSSLSFFSSDTKPTYSYCTFSIKVLIIFSLFLFQSVLYKFGFVFFHVYHSCRQPNLAPVCKSAHVIFPGRFFSSKLSLVDYSTGISCMQAFFSIEDQVLKSDRFPHNLIHKEWSNFPH